MNNCPFYGRAIYLYATVYVSQTTCPPFLLLDTQGNQCALVTYRHAPCMMEVDGQSIDWRECPRIKDIRKEEA